MTNDNGGERRLAPVINLFGGQDPLPADDSVSPESSASAEASTSADGPSWTVPLAAGQSASTEDDSQPAAERPRLRVVGDSEPQPSDAADDEAVATEQLREDVEEALVRKLRARSLSVSEARAFMREKQLSPPQIDEVVETFTERGYLDDLRLAEQLVTSGVERKGQGRVALTRALSQRGIPRDVVSAALDELPNDDAERALEFARTKARSMARLDFETELRRLVGQLARRGYNGHVAMTAARTALTEAGRPAKTSGVRFVDSD